MPCMRVDNYSEQGQQRWILHADEYRRLRPLLIKKHGDEEDLGSSNYSRVFHRTGMETSQEVSNNLSYFDYWCSLNLVLCHWEGPACEGHKARRPLTSCLPHQRTPLRVHFEHLGLNLKRAEYITCLLQQMVCMAGETGFNLGRCLV